MFPRLAHRALVFLKVYYALMVEYRAELYLWVFAGLLPFIMMGIWMKAAASPGNAVGLSPAQVVRYFLCVFIVRQLSVVWVIWDFEYQVVSGKLSPMLLQPVDPVWRFVAMHLSEQWARLPFSIAIAVLVLLLYPKALWRPDPLGVVLGFAAIYLAFTLRFLMQYSTAMLCFWFERAAGLETLLFLPYLFLSGTVAPLSAKTWPPAMLQLAMLTPFPYLIYFPARLLVGRDLPGLEIPLWKGFAVLAFWIALFYGLNRWLWSRGLRHYSAMGA
jgi:ABC-2 type transport system permease protein